MDLSLAWCDVYSLSCICFVAGFFFCSCYLDYKVQFPLLSSCLPCVPTFVLTEYTVFTLYWDESHRYCYWKDTGTAREFRFILKLVLIYEKENWGCHTWVYRELLCRRNADRWIVIEAFRSCRTTLSDFSDAADLAPAGSRVSLFEK